VNDRHLRPVEVTHAGPYCAPFALASVTGLPFDRFLPRDLRGRPRRAGLTFAGIEDALVSAGVAFRFEMIEPERIKVRSLRDDWRQRRAHTRARYPKLWEVLRSYSRGIVLVNWTSRKSHALAFSGFMVQDIVSRTPVWVHDHECANRGAWGLFRMATERGPLC
jgi:hypothetical protein